MKKSFLKTFGIAKLLPKAGKPSSVPGTVKYIGRRRKAPVHLTIMDYDKSELTEKKIKSVAESLPMKDAPTVTWLNINGVHNESIIHQIGENFDIHPLILEDIANTTQRPKIEEYEDYLYVVIKMADYDVKNHEVTLEQISLILGKNYVLSLQERDGDILDGLRDHIRTEDSKVRKRGSDYLLYAFIDAIVDNYFSVLEQIGEEIEAQEAKLLRNANQDLLNKIYSLKQELVFLRKSIWPMREVINTLLHAEHKLISEDTAIYMRDVYDHTIQVVETVETFRDMTSGMLDLYLSTVSNKMNEVMKVLTIFAAIFIPLTFLAGVYGMNFRYMPELSMRWAYPVWWVITTSLAVGMIIFFKKKKWL